MCYVVREIFPRLHSLCVIDVTGEATEFGIIENDILVENTFITSGTSTFVRDVMRETGKPTTISRRVYGIRDETDLMTADFKAQTDHV